MDAGTKTSKYPNGDGREKPSISEGYYVRERTSSNAMSLLFTVEEKVGALKSVLAVFEKHRVSLTHIESRPSRNSRGDYDFLVNLSLGPSANIDDAYAELKTLCKSISALARKENTELGPGEVPWFPTRISDLDRYASRVLGYGAELEADHPGFKDEEYRARRREITEIAQKYKYGEKIPRIEYTAKEIETWNLVFSELTKLYPTHACRQFNSVFPLLVDNCNYRVGTIPQLQEVSAFLKDCTGFTLRPVAGLLSSRDFLAGLAFRVFHSTQYIRHSSMPLYTPEPDVCHELLGHVPLFADPEFAQFSQEIGLASLGAPDEDIMKLATLYWFTVEFGICKEEGKVKAYGAGLLSSFGELEYCVSEKPDVRSFDPEKVAIQTYPITEYQPVYFCTDSFEEAIQKMRKYGQKIPRKFGVRYNPYSQRIEVIENKDQLPYLVNQVKTELSVLEESIQRLED